MIETEFPDEAVRELGEELEAHINRTEGIQSSEEGMNLMKTITRVSKRYEIPPEDRIDFACDGVRYTYYINQEKAVAQFRNALEPLEMFFHE